MIDLIHDVVGAYRELIKASSYPGDITTIKAYSKNNSIDVPFYDYTLLFVYMLLDAEVTFAVVGDYDSKAADIISRLTYAKQTAIEEADFIFILLAASPSDVEGAIKKAKIGTLVDPHESATLICEVKCVKSGPTNKISGPGIKKEKEINIDFVDEWIKPRTLKNQEYPLGIEMYFIDEDGYLVALPRTSQVKGGA